MSTKEIFKMIAIKYNWEYTRISTFGYYEEYFVMFGQNFYKKVISIDFDISDKKKVEILGKMLYDKRKEQRTSNVVITENGIVIFFKGIWKEVPFQIFTEVFEFVMQQIKKLGLDPIENPRV